MSAQRLDFFAFFFFLAAFLGAAFLALLADFLADFLAEDFFEANFFEVLATTIVEFARVLKRRVTFTPQLYRASFVLHLDTLRAGT